LSGNSGRSDTHNLLEVLAEERVVELDGAGGRALDLGHDYGGVCEESGVQVREACACEQIQ
jgi:hypothetical protein